MGLTVLGALTAPVVTLAALGTLDGLSRVVLNIPKFLNYQYRYATSVMQRGSLDTMTPVRRSFADDVQLVHHPCIHASSRRKIACVYGVRGFYLSVSSALLPHVRVCSLCLQPSCEAGQDSVGESAGGEQVERLKTQLLESEDYRYNALRLFVKYDNDEDGYARAALRRVV